MQSCCELKASAIWMALNQTQVIHFSEEVIPKDPKLLPDFWVKDRYNYLEEAWKDRNFRIRIIDLIDDLTEIYQQENNM